MDEKGNVGNLQNFIWGIVSVAITLGVGFAVLEGLQGTLTADTAGYNATGVVITKLGTVPTWIGIIIVVALAMIVMGYFYFR